MACRARARKRDTLETMPSLTRAEILASVNSGGLVGPPRGMWASYRARIAVALPAASSIAVSLVEASSIEAL